MQTTDKSLKEYVKTINKLEEYFNTINESLVDRVYVQVLLESLHKELSKISKEEKET